MILGPIPREQITYKDGSLTPPWQVWLNNLGNVVQAGNKDTRLVANLPPASASQFCRAFVTDATATTFNSIVSGGGTNMSPVWCDGQYWRIG